MVKKILQDVLPPSRKSIRHIPLPGNRKDTEVTEVPPSRKKTRRGRGFLRWIFILCVFVLIFCSLILFSWFFASATITITPKQLTSPVDVNLQSYLAKNADSLSHIIITATSTASEKVTEGREADVQRKASGKVVIYNNYSSEPQRLIKNTRLETGDGRIYRIENSVVVPGQTVENGKKVPGSVSVTAYADAPGVEYNLLLKDLKGDFTIPGFKGTPRYESFYARAQTDITGGFSGRAQVVDEKQATEAIEKLKSILTDDLLKKIAAAIPQGYQMFRSIYTIDYSTSSVDNPSGGVVFTVTGVARSAIFDVRTLSKAVVGRIIPDYKNENLIIHNMSELEVMPKVPIGKEMWETEPLVLSITGNAHVVWQFDENNMKNLLVGKLKKDTNGIMGSFGAVERAEVVIKPIWFRKYPSSKDKIHIKINLAPTQ